MKSTEEDINNATDDEHPTIIDVLELVNALKDKEENKIYDEEYNEAVAVLSALDYILNREMP